MDDLCTIRHFRNGLNRATKFRKIGILLIIYHFLIRSLSLLFFVTYNAIIFVI